jgi:hypothetical protein
MHLKPPTNPIDWPRGVRLSVYDEHMVKIEQSRDRKYDLNDNLFQAWDDRIVYLEVAVSNKDWHCWDTEALNWIESRIKWDLAFDGNEFSLRRHTRKRFHPCSGGFVWRIHVH